MALNYEERLVQRGGAKEGTNSNACGFRCTALVPVDGFEDTAMFDAWIAPAPL